jgi:hypothetical protein
MRKAMKATFPVEEFPWETYMSTVLFVAVAVVATGVVYGSLPARLATTWDFQNNPVGYMQKASYVKLVLGFMLVMAVLMPILDRFYVYPVFPVPMMSAISGSLELFCLIMHLLIINVLILPGLTVTHTIFVLLGTPCAYAILHMIVFRSDAADLPRGLPLWTDTPPHSWLTVVFFFARPILPHKVIAYNEGLLLQAATYRFAIPWEQIRLIKQASTGEAMGGIGVRVVSAPSRSVKLYLAGHKLPVIFSIEDEARLTAEWEKRRA